MQSGTYKYKHINVLFDQEGILFVDGKHLIVQKDAEGILRVKESINDAIISEERGNGNEDDDGVELFELCCIKIIKNIHNLEK